MPAFRKDAIEIIPAAGIAEQLRTELLVIGVFADQSLTGSPRRIDDLAGGRLSAALAQHGMGGNAGATILLDNLPGTAAAKLLVVDLGPADTFSDSAYLQALSAAGRSLARSGVSEAVVALPDAGVAGRPLPWHVRQAAQALIMGSCLPPDPEQAGAGSRAARRQRVMLLIPQALTSELVTALREGIAVARAVDIARRLADLPEASCTAAEIARMAIAIGDELDLTVELLQHDGTATPEGCEHPPGLIVMTSRRGRRARPIVLMGEGRTEPPGAEATTTTARAGIGPASAILGAMWMAGRLALPLNLVALIPAMAAAAWRDIIAHAERLGPDCLIDVAGPDANDEGAEAAATDCLYANDETLAAELVGCGARAGEPVRHLELDPAAARRAAPATDTPLHCLSRYTGPCRWAHLEVPELATDHGRAGTAQGHPVPLLAEFLIARARPSA